MKASPGSRFIQALQIGGLLGLGLFLWGVSLLPIQRAVLVCDCNVLVSPTEHAKLSELSRQSAISSTSIYWLACSPLSDSDRFRGDRSRGEVPVRRVRLRLGMVHRANLSELEKELAVLTASADTPLLPTAALQREVCHARWRLRVAEHALTRFRLDCSRNGIELPGLKELSLSDKKSPFRLASQSSLSRHSDVKVLFESLLSEIDTARQGVELAERDTAIRESEPGRIFTMNGSPRFVLRGGPLHRIRMSILLLSAFGIIGFVAIPRKRHRSDRKLSSGVGAQQELIRMLDGLRIPYLGVLPEQSDVKVNALPVAGDRPQPSRSRLKGLHRLSTCSRWSDRAIFIWLACFVLRYLLDPIWRELLFQAPLAAFSSVVFGV